MKIGDLVTDVRYERDLALVVGFDEDCDLILEIIKSSKYRENETYIDFASRWKHTEE